MPRGHADEKQVNYIPIRKDALLQDIKQFLYNYCTTGLLYPNHYRNKLLQEREEVVVNEPECRAYNLPEAPPPSSFERILARNQAEDRILYNNTEFQKAKSVRVLRIIYILKQMLAQ